MSEKLLQINQALQHKIHAEIKQKGQISFAEFMKMALYEPGLGYYSAGLHKIGSAGDFVTASELGSLFAKCHAKVFADVLQSLDSPIISELGAGTGQFCCDVLRALDDMKSLPKRYIITEVSADFKQVQADKINKLPEHLSQLVEWQDSPPQQTFTGIIFANEVIDALPVEVFEHRNQNYLQLHLHMENDQLSETWLPFNSEVSERLQQMKLNLTDGYRSEILPNLPAWIQTTTENLSQGLVMFIDYGYGRNTFYHPQRNNGTLVCQRRHQANFNPYQDIGLQDITAFVDFTAVAESLQLAGFELAGYTTQADFLLAAGIHQWVDEHAEFVDYYQLASEMKQLMLPDEMGEKFKVMAAVKNFDTDIIGFTNNRWHEL